MEKEHVNSCMDLDPELPSLKLLSEHFNSKLDDLGTLLALRNVYEDETCIEELESLQSQLTDIEINIHQLKKEIRIGQTNLGNMQNLLSSAKHMKEQLKYCVENIPERMPRMTQLKASDIQVASDQSINIQVPLRTIVDASVTKIKATTTSSSTTSKSENTYCPEISFLTVAEFEQIPKYMKGRISYDQINKFIEGMNKAYSDKYTLLKQKKAYMNDANRKKFEIYKLQETPETKGCYFISNDDLKEVGCFKIENVARSILTALRHCNRCREVRGGNLIRYVYIDTY